MKIFFAIPSYRGIKQAEFADSFNRSVKMCQKAGHLVAHATYRGCSSISLVRNNVVRDFMKTDGDVLFFLDDDLSWNPSATMSVINAPYEFVGGVYRMKCKKIVYPVVLDVKDGRVVEVGEADCIKCKRIPTGFMRLNRSVLEKMTEKYQDRSYRDKNFEGEGDIVPTIDMFPCGITDGYWESEDTGFCRLWEQIGGEMWLYPDITFCHFDDDGTYYRGNYAQWFNEQIIEEQKAKAAA